MSFRPPGRHGSPPSGSLPYGGIIAYAAELGFLAASRPTASDSPRIPVASPPNRRFSTPTGCLRHRLPSQVEPHLPAAENNSPPYEIVEIISAPKECSHKIAIFVWIQDNKLRMKRVFHIISLALFFVLFISCQPSPMLLLSGPHTYIFAHDGGAQNITFTCNRDWRVNTSESWILVSPSSGEASEEAITVKITCVANNTYDARTASITVIADELVETITINQETDFGLFVSPTSFNLTNTGQTIEVEVKHNVDYTIEIDEACRDWIREGQTKALSADKVTFLISANPSFENREGKISFKQTFGNHSQTVNICQHQTDTLYFEDAPFLDISGESQILELKINANCEYDIEVNAPNEDYEWIRYVETKGITS